MGSGEVGIVRGVHWAWSKRAAEPKEHSKAARSDKALKMTKRVRKHTGHLSESFGRYVCVYIYIYI